MKITLPQPLDPRAMIPPLSQMLPGYKFKMRGSKILVAEKSAAVGATILFRKDKLVINGNFPNMGLLMLFSVALVMLGILIPLVIYFLTLHRSHKASEQEVGAAMQSLVSGSQGHAQPGYPAYGHASHSP